MTKTFKSSRPTGTMLRVESTEVFSEAHLTIVLYSREEDICIAPSDAPALALAILEAAGVEPDREPLECQVSLGTIVADLQGTIQYAEALASANREQAELEAEALMLANSAVLAVGNPPYPSIEHMSDTSLRKWLAVARRAREINKETPNA